MAVKLLGNFVRYIGLSTDPKPTIGVPPGSTFYETNTKDIYIYDGTAWSEANATVQTGDTINIGDLEGKDVEGATVTGRPMTIGYKNAAGKATGVSPENALPVQLTGSNVDLRGLASERPAAAESNKNKTYWATDTGEVSVSTGTTWRVLGVA